MQDGLAASSALFASNGRALGSQDAIFRVQTRIGCKSLRDHRPPPNAFPFVHLWYMPLPTVIVRIYEPSPAGWLPGRRWIENDSSTMTMPRQAPLTRQSDRGLCLMAWTTLSTSRKTDRLRTMITLSPGSARCI